MLEDLRRDLRRRANRHPRFKRWLVGQHSRLAALRHAAATVIPWLIRPRTRNITVAVTAQCNLRCAGCRYGRDFMPGRSLSWEMVRDLLDDAGAAGVETVRLYGGEPFLHPDLARMIEHAFARGIDPYVTTNGTLLERRIDELYAAGLRFLTIGYYGTGNAYDAYVSRAESFRELERGVRAVRERYGHAVRMRINWLLMRPSCNLPSLREVWDFALRYETPIQVDLVHYSLPYFTEGPDRELQFRKEDRPAIERVVQELLRLKSERPELLEASEVGLRSIPDWLVKGPAMRVPCDKYDMIWVGADGTVQLCYVTFELGNLHETRLSELLFGKEHRRAALGAFCLDCPNCHCGYDSRVRKHLASRRQFGSGPI
jgi:MoaA/NifB/PqqE/SkfB family radical SAM enzyme